MKKFSIVLLIALLSTSLLHGQTVSDNDYDIESISYYRHHIYADNGEKIFSPDRVFAGTPAEYTWQKGIRQQKTGTALLISAGAISACGIIVYGVAIGGLDTKTGFAGLGIMGASIPFYAAGASMYVIGKKNKQRAINIYNQWKADTQAYLGVCPAGVQLVVKF